MSSDDKRDPRKPKSRSFGRFDKKGGSKPAHGKSSHGRFSRSRDDDRAPGARRRDNDSGEGGFDRREGKPARDKRREDKRQAFFSDERPRHGSPKGQGRIRRSQFIDGPESGDTSEGRPRDGFGRGGTGRGSSGRGNAGRGDRKPGRHFDDDRPRGERSKGEGEGSGRRFSRDDRPGRGGSERGDTRDGGSDRRADARGRGQRSGGSSRDGSFRDRSSRDSSSRNESRGQRPDRAGKGSPDDRSSAKPKSEFSEYLGDVLNRFDAGTDGPSGPRTGNRRGPSKGQGGRPERGGFTDRPRHGGPERGRPERGRPERGRPERGGPERGGPERRSSERNSDRKRPDGRNPDRKGPDRTGRGRLFKKPGARPALSQQQPSFEGKVTERPLRLQVYLSRCGIASRRDCEQLILDGKVEVNGSVTTELGTKVVPGKDRVKFEGYEVSTENLVYIAMHKPQEVICTMEDPQGRQLVVDLLPDNLPRVFPVGRLDYNTSGLIFMTNDGRFANFLMHPRHEVKKMYHVKIDRMLDSQHLEALTRGMTVDGEDYQGIEVFSLGNSGSNWWYEFHLTEGKYRQIRICLEHLGFQVRRLMRVAIGPIAVDGIKRGTWRYLTKDELTELGYAPPPAARNN